jgi:hypothetical protein
MAGFNNYCINIQLILLIIQFLMEFSIKMIKFTATIYKPVHYSLTLCLQR